jgi:hydroxymethylpyrimidine pyrophosphatase-like HAD family hydrolase
VSFRWRREWGAATSVRIATSADGWAAHTPLVRDADGAGDWSLRTPLPPGRLEYKFLVDDAWREPPSGPAVAGSGNGVVHVSRAVACVTLAYASGWAQPRVALPAADGMPPSEVLMRPCGPGHWTATLPVASGHDADAAHAAASSASPALSFVLTDGAGAVDAPPGGGLYRCPHPGGYKLARGRLTSFAAALRAPVMLVTDLDGTLVGDTPEADAATSAFRDYWDSHARLAGGVLVFNTGRSIGQVMSLLRDKAAHMPHPDVIVTAVGTKIFTRKPHAPAPAVAGSGAGASAEACSSGQEGSSGSSSARDGGAGASSSSSAAPPAPPPIWEEGAWEVDAAWATHLNEGWRLSGAQAAAGAVVAAFDGACHWLDKGTEHPHRVSLAVRADTLEAACARLRQGLAEERCGARTIVSGAGDWRYVDAVAPRAGKREAAEHVRRAHGVATARTVTAGDSGNDTDMLSGAFPAVVVGNAQPDLAAWALAQRQDGRVVHTAAHCAHGILEGLARHGLY